MPILECIEQVVLLSPDGQAIGTADKSTIHTAHTPLHSAFSIFLFNRRGEMLLQQRAWTKQTWPGIWSNACCGHPLPGEAIETAAHRRLNDELGLTEVELKLALPHFRYRAEYRGIVENEICPVFIGACNLSPMPNPIEVAATRWIAWQDFLELEADTEKRGNTSFSPWSRLEAVALREAGIDPIEQLFFGR